MVVPMRLPTREVVRAAAELDHVQTGHLAEHLELPLRGTMMPRCAACEVFHAPVLWPRLGTTWLI
ncbi:MAG: hypothetical protein RL701_2730, partial [Pseudomonadota bacterium]